MEEQARSRNFEELLKRDVLVFVRPLPVVVYVTLKKKKYQTFVFAEDWLHENIDSAKECWPAHR